MSSAGFVMPDSAHGGGSAAAPVNLPTSTVELSIKCNKLVDKDLFSKSDPICILFHQPRGAAPGKWTELGRTEQIKDNINPEWETKFVIDYSFEERQPIKFEVYDVDSKSQKLNDQDFLGRCETTLGAVVAGGSNFAAVLKDGPRNNSGRIFISAEELRANKASVRLQLAAKSLDKKDTFGKSDPFFVLSKASPSGQFVVVHKSEVVKNNLNPVWNPFTISLRDLCNNDQERPLKIEVFDWDSNGKHDQIGWFKTDFKSLSVAMPEQKTFGCIYDKKAGKKGYKNSGEVFVKDFHLDEQVSFLDYVQGGTALNFSVAVDFTASNGVVTDPRSLHFRNPQGDNQYTTAIKAVGDIIQDYDADKMFPALGFGARVPPGGQLSHEFFLNLRQDNPYCAGVDGLLQAYYTALQNVELYGPTNFAPIIRHVSRFAEACQDGKQYFVLLILTDGIITDFEDTMSAVINASSLPMSIIIVGVGNEDFSAMDALDSDRELLSHQGRQAARDMVQFVRMNKFVGGGAGMWNKEMLAKEVLAEVPKQLVGWMKVKGLKPRKV